MRSKIIGIIGAMMVGGGKHDDCYYCLVDGAKKQGRGRRRKIEK